MQTLAPSLSKEYYQRCPKTDLVEKFEDRVRLNESYHHLNHYAIFGGCYKSGILIILKALNKKYGD
jgi:hypothetical protein